MENGQRQPMGGGFSFKTETSLSVEKGRGGPNTIPPLPTSVLPKPHH